MGVITPNNLDAWTLLTSQYLSIYFTLLIIQILHWS